MDGKFASFFLYKYVNRFKEGESLDALLDEAINYEYSIESSFFD